MTKKNSTKPFGDDKVCVTHSAEPFKQWLAKVGAERLDQMQDPELSIQQAIADYKRLGYSEEWINQRLRSLKIRSASVGNVNQDTSLTDIIYQAWAGRTTKEYKQLKGLKKENLRDNMTNEELVLNMLAELAAISITNAKNPQTLDENKACVQEGGDIARVAREQLEAKTGREVVSPLSAKRFFEGQKKTEEIENNNNNN